jgi:hypothetical protein
MQREKVVVLIGFEKVDGSWNIQPCLCIVRFGDNAWGHGAAFDEFGELLFEQVFGLNSSTTDLSDLTQITATATRWFLPFDDGRDLASIARHFVTTLEGSSGHAFALKLNSLGFEDASSATLEGMEFDKSQFKSLCLAVTKSREGGHQQIDDFVDLILFNNCSERFGIEYRHA